MNTFVIGMAAGAVLVLVYAFFRAGFRVDNGSTAVLTVFGRFQRDGSGKVRTFGPGLHWKSPWAKAITVSLAERSMSLLPKGASMEVLAADGTRIRVNARLRFRVDEKYVAKFLAESRDAIEDLHGLFQLTVREQVARFEQRPEELSAFTALRQRMNELQHRTQEAMKADALEEYGIQVVAVDLLGIDPPEELVDALNAVITAESEANALVARTQLQAQQRVLAAEQAVEIANGHALATEAEIRTVGAELALLQDQGVLKDYVERRQLEVLGGSRRIYLNHDATSSSLRS